MSIEFTINGKPYSVQPQDHPADITLNTFIREYAKLFGTKFYCLEGGCGVCTVTVRRRHPSTNRYYSRSVNSCLVLLNVCNGWDIITIEGLGNSRVGYHPIQERLEHFNGTQCGYCSPGMIMNMFGNLEASEGRMTMKEIETSFGGNLCRCTGYRPILDAMKSFAADSEYQFVDMCNDIEDLKICSKVGTKCKQICRKSETMKFNNTLGWYYPQSLKDVFDIFVKIKGEPYILSAGNTAHGIYRRDPLTRIFIDISGITELHESVMDKCLVLGANITLTDASKLLQDKANQADFEYFEQIVKHLGWVAHIAVRNIGTIAGNLMIKHQHNEFPSDVFLLLTTVGAQITIAESSERTTTMSLPEFLKLDMHEKLILKISLLPLNKANMIFDSYKITPRTQNAHAYVNAGFLVTFADSAVTLCRICFGGIRPDFLESSLTMEFLRGRSLFFPDTIRDAINILNSEIEPDWVLPDASPEYRKRLAIGLFYKFMLKHAPSVSVRSEYRSGGSLLKRPISTGAQTFDTRKDVWPINKPVRKLEAMWQCSGEAIFANDIPFMRDEVWAAFVPATEVHGTVARIDPTDALTIPGVVAFYSAKDIPGVNSFVTTGLFAILEDEELFCAQTVKYHSQPVGVILAISRDLANYAAMQVKILYVHGNKKEVAATLKDSIKDRREKAPKVESLARKANDQHKSLSGYFDLGSQFYFSMETHTTVCIPREGGLLIYPSSHYIDLVQVSVANTLKIKESQIDIEVRRLGGSFGCKISRSSHVAVACALASWLSNRPVRFVQTIESNMSSIGRRNACVSDYAANVDERGKLQSFAMNFYEDMGFTTNESPIKLLTIPSIPNCYDDTEWVIHGNDQLTDAPSHSWCRSPGTLEGIAMIENVMEHIARVVNKDPVDVRMANIPHDSVMKKLLQDFIKSTDYRARKAAIDVYNVENRWKKRGIAISIMRFHIFYFANISATVAIYHQDGSVAVSHGGVECGQGINTKAAQVAAYILGIPLDMINVKASNNFSGANSIMTGASVTSETVCFAVRKACKELLNRIKPVRDKLKNPSWVQLIRKSYEANINLVTTQIHKVDDMESYYIWGLACSEMEVDILTGNHQITRVDILEDTGESLNPLLDVGQVEGAFVMGLGYWLTEHLVFNRQTGELMNTRTWNYKVPGAQDIPIDFRITLLQKNPNSGGFLRSKATGEIATCMSISTLFALRHALDSARKDAGLSGWYHLGAPTTVEDVLLAARHTFEDFEL